MKQPDRLIPGLALIVLGTGAACASGSSRSAQDCTLAAADSVYLAAGPLYRDCAVDRPARATARPVQFSPPARVLNRDVTCYNAEVQLIVNANGQPEPGTAKLLRGNDALFSDAVMASIESWHYQPALLAGRPVRQIVKDRVSRALVVTTTVTSSGSAGRPPRPPAPKC
jgi:hypothetical protein